MKAISLLFFVLFSIHAGAETDSDRLTEIRQDLIQLNLLRKNAPLQLMKNVVKSIKEYDVVGFLNQNAQTFHSLKRGVSISQPVKLSKDEIENYLEISSKEPVALLAFNDNTRLAGFELLFDEQTRFLIVRESQKNVQNSKSTNKWVLTAGIRG